MLLPRLRSTKNSGGLSLRDAIAADYLTRRPRCGAQAAARVATRITSST